MAESPAFMMWNPGIHAGDERFSCLAFCTAGVSPALLTFLTPVPGNANLPIGAFAVAVAISSVFRSDLPAGRQAPAGEERLKPSGMSWELLHFRRSPRIYVGERALQRSEIIGDGKPALSCGSGLQPRHKRSTRVALPRCRRRACRSTRERAQRRCCSLANPKRGLCFEWVRDSAGPRAWMLARGW